MNEAEFQIKRITDFPIEEAATPFQRPAIWMALFVFMAINGSVAITYALLERGELPSLPFTAFMALTFFCLLRSVLLVAEARSVRAKKFAAYLESVNPDVLKVVAASPEYDQETKDAIIKYLSDAHPGWSLT